MRNKIITITVATLFLGLSLWNLLGVKSDYSDSERRVLAKFPEINLETIMSGDFADEFEDYLVDHFPKRDSWRGIKAFAKKNVFRQKDNHGLFQVNGHVSKMEYPMNEPMIDHAVKVFSKVNEKYLDESNQIYLAIVPDKNRYLAKENGYLSMDYERFSENMAKGLSFAKYIEIADLLEANDYYFTDSHWRQEKIIDVSERILEEMNSIKIPTASYTEETLENPFYGVYVGQLALKCKPDKITYLTSDMINTLEIEGADAIYDMKKAEGKDPYEMFLSGNQPVITIKNSMQDNGRKLIIFRDSFGSSIAPLLAEGYEETVLIDLRYVSSDMLGQFVDFEGADVLFLYSTMLLNNSLAIK